MFVATAAIVAVVVVAWTLQAMASGGGDSSEGDSPPPYSVSVKRGAEVLKTYDVAALRSLPQVTVEMEGKDQTGPALAVVLADAGVSTYDEVDVRGGAIRDSGQLALSSVQVRRRVQLDFSQRGTVKVCAPWLERREWVRDVLTITVE